MPKSADFPVVPFFGQLPAAGSGLGRGNPWGLDRSHAVSKHAYAQGAQETVAVM